MKAEKTEILDPMILDAVSYAMAKGVDYLGAQGQTLLDRMGEEILNYLAERGEIDPRGDPMQTAASIDAYFGKHGFFAYTDRKIERDTFSIIAKLSSWSSFRAHRTLLSKGSQLLACPACLAGKAIFNRMKIGYDFSMKLNEQDDCIEGNYRLFDPNTGKPFILSEEAIFIPGMPAEERPIEMVVGRVVFYAMAKALDYLGAQGQILLERMGGEILNYLVEKGEIELGEDPFEALKQLTEYFKSRGFISNIETELLGETLVMKVEGWGYFDAFQDLREKECSLVSCPLTITVASLFRRAGYALQLTSFEPIDPTRKTVLVKGQLINLKQESFTEEMEKEMLGKR